jgi:hypothetical protein
MVAVVALAASAAAVPRVAVAASPGVADPGLTLSADPTAMRSGDVLQLTGHLSVPGATLVLSRRTATEADFAILRTLTADGSGSTMYALRPQVGATYRLDFAGDATWAPAHSEVAVAVAPRISLSAAYRRPLFSGDLVTLRLAVSPAHPGAEAELQRRDGGSWVTFKHVTLDIRSRATVRWRIDRTRGLRIRAHLAADADHIATSSRRRSLFANPANAHRVPCRFAHYIVIVVHEYTLYYYEHGKVARRFNVALGRPGYPTPIGTFHIYGKRRPGGGALGACVMYYYPPGAIAIHGTDQPYLLNDPLPRNYSHGCCRMYNSQALWLFRRCPGGTTVHNLR